MEITIVGTGAMAKGIAARARAGRNAVTIVGRHPSRAQALPAQLPCGAPAGTIGDPLRGSVAILAVPYRAVEGVLGRYAPELHSRVLVEITYPLDPTTLTEVAVRAGSAA